MNGIFPAQRSILSRKKKKCVFNDDIATIINKSKHAEDSMLEKDEKKIARSESSGILGTYLCLLNDSRVGKLAASTAHRVEI